MIVVSDTTPLRSLAVLGEMALLPRLFGEVSIPMAVLDECRHPSAPASLREWSLNPPAWMRVVEIVSLDPRTLDLDQGEAAAITTALAVGADLLLIDERKGRARAGELGLKRTGTLALLAQAGRRGWLDYHAAVARLLLETRFRASAAVIDTTWNESETFTPKPWLK
jgi:predicted nucleic acid-binding protein